MRARQYVQQRYHTQLYLIMGWNSKMNLLRNTWTIWSLKMSSTVCLEICVLALNFTVKDLRGLWLTMHTMGTPIMHIGGTNGRHQNIFLSYFLAIDKGTLFLIRFHNLISMLSWWIMGSCSVSVPFILVFPKELTLMFSLASCFFTFIFGKLCTSKCL